MRALPANSRQATPNGTHLDVDVKMPDSSSGGPIQVETGSVSISEADVASGKPYNITPIVILRFHLAVHLEHLQAHIYRTAGILWWE